MHPTRTTLTSLAAAVVVLTALAAGIGPAGAQGTYPVPTVPPDRTTVLPPDVGGASTTAPSPVGAPDGEVLGAEVVATGPVAGAAGATGPVAGAANAAGSAGLPAEVRGATLALTGGEVAALVVTGLLLLVGGAALLALRRRPATR